MLCSCAIYTVSFPPPDRSSVGANISQSVCLLFCSEKLHGIAPALFTLTQLCRDASLSTFVSPWFSQETVLRESQSQSRLMEFELTFYDISKLSVLIDIYLMVKFSGCKGAHYFQAISGLAQICSHNISELFTKLSVDKMFYKRTWVLREVNQVISLWSDCSSTI